MDVSCLFSTWYNNGSLLKWYSTRYQVPSQERTRTRTVGSLCTLCVVVVPSYAEDMRISKSYSTTATGTSSTLRIGKAGGWGWLQHVCCMHTYWYCSMQHAEWRPVLVHTRRCRCTQVELYILLVHTGRALTFFSGSPAIFRILTSPFHCHTCMAYVTFVALHSFQLPHSPLTAARISQ